MKPRSIADMVMLSEMSNVRALAQESSTSLRSQAASGQHPIISIEAPSGSAGAQWVAIANLDVKASERGVQPRATERDVFVREVRVLHAPDAHTLSQSKAPCNVHADQFESRNVLCSSRRASTGR